MRQVLSTVFQEEKKESTAPAANQICNTPSLLYLFAIFLTEERKKEAIHSSVTRGKLFHATFSFPAFYDVKRGGPCCSCAPSLSLSLSLFAHLHVYCLFLPARSCVSLSRSRDPINSALTGK